MRSNEHAWRRARAAMGQRFFLGAIVAGSLTLVAFEWRMTPSDAVPWSEDLPAETDWDEAPIIVTFEKPKPKAPAPKRAGATADPTGPAAPSADPSPEPTTDPGTGPSDAPVDDPAAANSTTLPYTPYVPNLPVKPHFKQCILEDPEHVDPCTEDRIQAHLQRRFEMPRNVRGHIRTTVTFSVEADGRIGRIVCAPKVDEEVMREVERVLRALPRFEPGTQGGIPVPVHYQIPLSLRAG